jgi:hypothetical protein
VYDTAGDVVEARETILLLEFTAVHVGNVGHDRADKRRYAAAWRRRRPRSCTKCPQFVCYSMRGRPQFPHTPLIPFPQSCPQSQCRYRVRGVQGKGAHREEMLNLEREKLNLWGGRPMMRGRVPPRPRSVQEGTYPGGTTPAARPGLVAGIRCGALRWCGDVNVTLFRRHALP